MTIKHDPCFAELLKGDTDRHLITEHNIHPPWWEEHQINRDINHPYRSPEKLFLHNKVLFLNSPKTSRKLLHFDLKSEFVTCVYVITLCILFLESIAVDQFHEVCRCVLIGVKMTKTNDWVYRFNNETWREFSDCERLSPKNLTKIGSSLSWQKR